MNNFTQHCMRWTAPVFSVILLAACSSGGDDAPVQVQPLPPSPPPIAQKGIEGVGVVSRLGSNLESITVSDVTYDTTSSALTITIDNQPATLADLNVGNVVRVAATTNDDGVSSVATNINQINDLEGPIAAGSIDEAAGTFVVLGQTVRVVATTLFDDSINPSSIEGLADGIDVEVSGLLDGTGVVLATRIEADDDAGDFEVTGVISGLDAASMRFDMNALTVDYSSAMLEDFDNGMPAVGDLVEVYGDTLNANGELVALRVEKKLPSFTGAEGDFGEIEGIITRFDSSTDFDVDGIAVATTSATRYEDGTANDLMLGVRVDVAGTLDAGGVLVASEIDFEDFEDQSRIEVEATVAAVDQAAGTIEVLGLSISVTSATAYEDDSDLDIAAFGLSDIAAGDYLEMVLVAGDAGLEAVLIERDDADTESSVRGPIDSLENPQLVVLGVAVETTSSTQFERNDTTPISAAEFFAAVGVGSIVDVEGLWNGSALVADEAELED
ncbi:MAG: DUF5666 domain-containing protein [Gammaproteobacteria bacterium]